MHQIPPLIHSMRNTALDVHHTIVARTTRLKLDPRVLFDNAVALADRPTRDACALVLRSPDGKEMSSNSDVRSKDAAPPQPILVKNRNRGSLDISTPTAASGSAATCRSATAIPGSR
jgi:hypothetical protein